MVPHSLCSPRRGVGVLVAGGAVEHVQAVAVPREVGGHPVQDHADAGLVQLVHKGHKVLGGAVAAGGRKIAGYLVAPAAVKRIFGDGQQLHMGVAHILDIGDQQVGDLGIVVGRVLVLHLPAAHVHLVDADGRIDDVLLFLLFQPGAVVPGIAVQVVDLAAVGGAGLGMEGVRVRLEQKLVRRAGDAEFIDVVLFDPGDKKLPDPFLDLGHRMAAGDPAVKIAYHRHRLGVGRPDTEHRAVLAVLLAEVGAEIPLCLLVVTLFEQENGIPCILGCCFVHCNLPFTAVAHRQNLTTIILPVSGRNFKVFLLYSAKKIMPRFIDLCNSSTLLDIFSVLCSKNAPPPGRFGRRGGAFGCSLAAVAFQLPRIFQGFWPR